MESGEEEDVTLVVPRKSLRRPEGCCRRRLPDFDLLKPTRTSLGGKE